MHKLIRSIVMALLITLFMGVIPSVLIIGYLVTFGGKELSFANYELLLVLFGGVFIIFFLAYLFKERK